MIKLYDLYIFIYVSLELVLSKVVGSSNIDFTISNICLLFSKKKKTLQTASCYIFDMKFTATNFFD